MGTESNNKPIVWPFYVIAGYFFALFNYRIGFPPDGDLDQTTTAYILLSVFFVLIPKAQSLTIGKIFKFEARTEALKQEVSDFKEETRSVLQTYNNLITTVSNSINNSVIVNIPSFGQIQKAREDLDQVAKTLGKDGAKETSERKVQTYLLQENDEPSFALVKLRIELEKRLRGILKKRVTVSDPLKIDYTFLGLKPLFRTFLKKNPEYKDILPPFDYLLKACDAAAHGQRMDNHYIEEALKMGVEILELLNDH